MAVTTEELKAKLTADVEQFNKAIASTIKSLNSFNKSLIVSDKNVVKSEQHTKKYLSTLKSLAVGVGQAKFALQNLYSVTGGVIQRVIEANSGIEKTVALLKSMSKGGTKLEAIEEFNKLIDLSKKAPFSIEALSDALVKFKSVGIEPAFQGVSSLANAVAAFGGSDDVLKRASIAIQQMGGKGVISMEELRQQLGEAVPTAVSLMARSLNMTYAELVKKISLGQVEAKGAISAMLGEMERSFGGAGEAMMRNWEGMTKQMKTNLLLFFKEIGDSGVMKTAKEGLKEFTNFLISPDGIENARKLGEFFTGIMKVTAVIVKTLYEFKDIILTIIKVIAIGGIIKGFGKLKTSIVGSKVELSTLIASLGFMSAPINGLINNLASAGTNFSKFNNQSAVATAKMREFGSSMMSARTKISTTSTVLFSFVNILKSLALPIVFVGLQIISSWLIKIIKTGERATEAVRKFKEEAAKPIPMDIKDIESRIKYIKNIFKLSSSFKEGGVMLKLSLYDKVQLEKELSELEESLPKMKESLEKQLSTDLFKQTFSKLFEEEQKISKAYNEKQIVLEKERAATIGLTNQQRKDLGVTEEQLNKKSSDAIDEYIKKHKMLIMSMRLESYVLFDQGKITAEAYGRIVTEINNYNKAFEEKNRLMKEGQSLQKEDAAFQIKDPTEKNLATEFYNATIKKLELQGKVNAVAKEEALGITNARSLMLNNIKDQKERNSAWTAGTAELQRLNNQTKENNKIGKQQDTALGNIKDKYTKLIEANELLNEEYKNSNENVKKSIIQDKAQIGLMVQKAGGTKEAIELQKKYNDALADNQALTWVSKLPELLKESQAETIKTTKESQLALNEFNRNQQIMILESSQLFKQNEEVKRKAIKDTNIVFDNYAKAIEIKNKTSFEKMLEDWSSAEYTMSEGMKSAFESASDAIMEFVETGKIGMSDLVKSIMLDMVKLSMQRNILAPLGDMLNGITKNLGSLFSNSGGFSGIFSTIAGSLFHTGGIVGSNAGATRAVSSMAFMGAPRFHNGGFPGLKQDEVPAILQKGEGVFTKEQMSSSGSVKSNVQVNVINQTSQPVSAETSQPRFDGTQMVLDVVLRAMNQPGSFRDGMKQSIR